MGVLGWSPRDFWDEATLHDTAAVIEGWAQSNGIKLRPDLPSKSFLEEMQQKFPDI